MTVTDETRTIVAEVDSRVDMGWMSAAQAAEALQCVGIDWAAAQAARWKDDDCERCGAPVPVSADKCAVCAAAGRN